jgi:hypothetical protein
MTINQDITVTAALQIVRLKGRVSAEMLADSLGIDAQEASTHLHTLQERGAISEAKGQFRLSQAGRELLAERIAAERNQLDQPALQSAYHAFHSLNTEFKQIVTDWQMRAGQANDHTDAAYDAGVIQRLVDLDQRWNPLLNSMIQLAARLAPYPTRFTVALQKLRAGDAIWFARPIVDSYHTVWFELHEDLIGMLGLSREAEAAAGRAE